MMSAHACTETTIPILLPTTTTYIQHQSLCLTASDATYPFTRPHPPLLHISLILARALEKWYQARCLKWLPNMYIHMRTCSGAELVCPPSLYRPCRSLRRGGGGGYQGLERRGFFKLRNVWMWSVSCERLINLARGGFLLIVFGVRSKQLGIYIMPLPVLISLFCSVHSYPDCTIQIHLHPQSDLANISAMCHRMQTLRNRLIDRQLCPRVCERLWSWSSSVVGRTMTVMRWREAKLGIRWRLVGRIRQRIHAFKQAPWRKLRFFVLYVISSPLTLTTEL